MLQQGMRRGNGPTAQSNQSSLRCTERLAVSSASHRHIALQIGPGPWTAQALHASVPAEPFPPPARVVVIDWTQTTATIQWSGPLLPFAGLEFEGQLCAISTYARERWMAALRPDYTYAKDESLSWITVFRGPSLACLVDMLEPGCQYCFRLRTVCSLKPGPWSRAVKVLSVVLMLCIFTVSTTHARSRVLS
jgi:hypothetical protein